MLKHIHNAEIFKNVLQYRIQSQKFNWLYERISACCMLFYMLICMLPEPGLLKKQTHDIKKFVHNAENLPDNLFNFCDNLTWL